MGSSGACEVLGKCAPVLQLFWWRRLVMDEFHESIRIIRQAVEGLPEGPIVGKVPRLLNETAERPVSIGAASVKQKTEALRFPIGVDPFADGAGRITAAHGKRLNKEM